MRAVCAHVSMHNIMYVRICVHVYMCVCNWCAYVSMHVLCMYTVRTLCSACAYILMHMIIFCTLALAYLVYIHTFIAASLLFTGMIAITYIPLEISVWLGVHMIGD